eukprot:6828507-Pyramimonas_sp.AAC.1
MRGHDRSTHEGALAKHVGVNSGGASQGPSTRGIRVRDQGPSMVGRHMKGQRPSIRGSTNEGPASMSGSGHE